MVKVLFDNNMPLCIARALHELIAKDGHEAVALRDKFSPKISDIEFFTELGKEKDWIVVSGDRKQASRRPERSAIIRSGVLAFYLSPSVEKQRINEQAATILWQWDKIVSFRNLTSNGLFLLPVNKGSKFKSL